MSMIMALRRASDEEIAELLDNPERISWFLFGETPRKPKVGFLQKLFGKKKSEFPFPEYDENWVEPVKDITDLDKAWHGIHYLLTGSDWKGQWPLSFLLDRGQEIGTVDVGYGPARAFMASEVKEINAALSPLTGEMLKTKFNPAEMMKMQIYPTIWDRKIEEDDTLGYTLEYFNILKKFVADTADKNQGVIIYLC